MATGWKLIDDVYYYFDDQGAMYRNRFLSMTRIRIMLMRMENGIRVRTD